MVSYYNGTQPGHAVGVLDSPYYWWEGGAMFDTLLQYWHLTSDSQYNSIITKALIAQQGPNSDFMPPNQTKSEGNDDQAIWALAAMSAAEFQLPESSGVSWVSLAEAVFNDQVARWDTSMCNGGLRWQIFPFNTGYTYKNAVSNGLFFQLASRLARYTGNSTYSDWSSRAYAWSTDIGFVDSKSNVYDGASTGTNCSSINRLQLSYAAGTYIAGAAYMYNTTSGSNQWKSALDGLLNQTLTVFFPSGIATEIACENQESCSVDMYALKGILAQQLLDAVQMAPYTAPAILPRVNATAQAAAKACGTGFTCAFVWSGNKVGNDTGLGQQLSALSYVQGLLVGQAPVTGTNGGTNATTTNGTASSTAATTGSTATGSKSAGSTLGGQRLGVGLMAAGISSLFVLVTL
jgi:mannan endo-1,6-alpha-mannosidase